MDDKEDLLCYCTGTTRSKIQQLLNEQMMDLKAIINETGVTTGCAACEYDVTQFVEQALRVSRKA